MKPKKYAKDSLMMVGTGITLGVGSSVLGSLGGSAANSAQSGLGKMSSAMPIMGSIYGAGMVMDSLDDLKKSAKRKR